MLGAAAMAYFGLQRVYRHRLSTLTVDEIFLPSTAHIHRSFWRNRVGSLSLISILGVIGIIVVLTHQYTWIVFVFFLFRIGLSAIVLNAHQRQS